jgi:hypothetical protein
MQRLLTKLINAKINAATSHIRRIIMSEDTNENPAELYGKDGKIYYRSAGGSGVELAGDTSLWATENVGAYPAITPNPSSNISLKKTKSIMNPNNIYIRLENPLSAGSEEDVDLTYYWEDIGGSAGTCTSHYQEESP